MNMIGYAVHLNTNAAHPSRAPDVLYIISLQYTSWQMQCTQVGLLKYSMASTVHLMANIVHPSEALDVR